MIQNLYGVLALQHINYVICSRPHSCAAGLMFLHQALSCRCGCFLWGAIRQRLERHLGCGTGSWPADLHLLHDASGIIACDNHRLLSTSLCQHHAYDGTTHTMTGGRRHETGNSHPQHQCTRQVHCCCLQEWMSQSPQNSELRCTGCEVLAVLYVQQNCEDANGQDSHETGRAHPEHAPGC